MAEDILKRILISVMVVVGLSTTVFADFYVIPVNKKIKNVVTVAKSGGQFTDIQAAIDSITDASATNPYVIYIGPGIYSVAAGDSIVMKNNVSLIGSGVDSTVIVGQRTSAAFSPSAGLILASDAEIAQMSIDNNVTSNAEGGVTGIYTAQPTYMHDLKVSVAGGTNQSNALYISNAAATVQHVKLLADGSAGYNGFGITANSSDVTLDSIEITTFGGTGTDQGVYFYNCPSTVQASNLNINSELAVNTQDSPVLVRNSYLEGSTYSVFNWADSDPANTPTYTHSVFVRGDTGSYESGANICLHCTSKTGDVTCN